MATLTEIEQMTIDDIYDANQVLDGWQAAEVRAAERAGKKS